MTSSAAGGFYESELDRHALGRFHRRDVTVIVRRRRLRIAFGNRHALRIELGEARPVSVEVREDLAEGGQIERVAIPHVPAPRVQLVQRIAALWLASTLILWIARRLRAY